jgi:hypothetical protein
MMQVTKENLPQLIEELDAVIGELPEKGFLNRGFADSLINGKYGFRKRGFLSEKQMPYIGKLLRAAVLGPQEQPKENAGAMTGLVEFFNKAKEHLKYPKISVEVDGYPFRLSLAGPQAKRPGWITLTDGGPYGANQWYGRVSPEGVWEQPYNMNDDVRIVLLRVLHQFSKDAAAAATKYGHLSGNCCFCNTPIGEGDDQRSVEAGYGPQCAKNYNLPWGKKK